MFDRMRIALPLICALNFPANVPAQQTDNLPKPNQSGGQQELSNVIQDAQKLTPAFANVLVRAKAASLLAQHDPAKADAMFLELWNFALQQTDPAFDLDQALNTILKNLFPKNAKLAKRLVDERLQEEDAKQEKDGSSANKNLPRLARLSSELADSEPSMASAYLESALSQGVTPVGLSALKRLRQRDPLLSDYVVTKTLVSVEAMRTLVSLGSLNLLISYVFPESQSFSIPTEYESSLESLQFRYFATAYEVLKRSLGENEALLLKMRIYSSSELKMRGAYQAQLAMILASLAPRYHPALAIELTNVSAKLLTQVPSGIAQLAQFTAARLSNQSLSNSSPEISIPIAISSGDFQEASLQIDRLQNSEQRSLYSQLLIRVQAKAALSKADLNDALTFIRRLKDPNARLILYMEAGTLARKKDQSNISTTIVSEARSLIPQTERNGLHVRALLAFSEQLARVGSTQEAFEFLDAAVLSLNALSVPNDDSQKPKTDIENAWAELNDPQNIAMAQEFESCFTLLGRVDMEQALAEATKIKNKTAQLMARLAVIHEPLGRTKTTNGITRPPVTSAPSRNN